MWFWAGAAVAQSSSSVEARKIEHLIAAVARLSDAKFIRNRTAYDAGKAAEHLRLKLREAGGRVANHQRGLPARQAEGAAELLRALGGEELLDRHHE